METTRAGTRPSSLKQFRCFRVLNGNGEGGPEVDCRLPVVIMRGALVAWTLPMTGSAFMQNQQLSDEVVIVSKLLSQAQMNKVTEDWDGEEVVVTPLADEMRPIVPAQALQAFQLMTERMFEECIHPLLGAQDEAAFIAILDEKLMLFAQMFSARSHFAHFLSRGARPRPVGRDFVCAAAHSSFGSDAAADVDFSTSTYREALAMANRLDGVRVDEASAAADRQMAGTFQGAKILHMFGAALLLEIDRRRMQPSEWLARATCQLIREGALEAYAAAAEGVSLRKPQRQPEAPEDMSQELMDLANWDS